jgi:hypothetical protein
MDENPDEIFQIGALVVIGLTVVAIAAFLVIGVNPQIAINPFKPPLPTGTATRSLPPTWTPTSTNTPTSTSTPTVTPSITPTPTATDTPTSTPIPSNTPRPTPRPPTRTPAPPPPPSYPYFITLSSCEHSGGTFIEGYVNSAQGPLSGISVSYGTSPGSNVAGTVVTEGTEGRVGHYTFVLSPNNARPGTWYVWITDGTGKLYSDPNAGRIVTNNIKDDNSGSCWRAEVDFARR